MKKLFITLILACATLPVLAQHHGYRHNYHYHGHYKGGNWVTPLVIGGIVGYALTRPEPVIVQQPPLVIQSPIPPIQYCTPWTETQHPDGTITRTRTCQ